jgi:hypothetical protein
MTREEHSKKIKVHCLYRQYWIPKDADFNSADYSPWNHWFPVECEIEVEVNAIPEKEFIDFGTYEKICKHYDDNCNLIEETVEASYRCKYRQGKIWTEVPDAIEMLKDAAIFGDGYLQVKERLAFYEENKKADNILEVYGNNQREVINHVQWLAKKHIYAFGTFWREADLGAVWAVKNLARILSEINDEKEKERLLTLLLQ